MTLRYTLTSNAGMTLDELEKFCSDARSLGIPGNKKVEHIQVAKADYSGYRSAIQITYDTELS